MNRFALVGAVALAAGAASAQNIVEDFGTVLPAGWVGINRSTTIGTTGWFQGNDAVFPAQSGAPTSYLGANFNNTTGANTISNWALLPERTLNNGDTFSFWTRTVSNPQFPDRLQVRLSQAGSSTNVGTTATSVGDFTTTLLTINNSLIPTGYPNVWTQFNITLSGLPGAGVNGRLAFRYFVTSGGPSGANSDYIGIDTVRYTQIPAPGALALVGLGGLAAGRRRR